MLTLTACVVSIQGGLTPLRRARRPDIDRQTREISLGSASPIKVPFESLK